MPQTQPENNSPFGMVMPDRSYTSSSAGYRFGYNRMEQDDEVKGSGNSLDFGSRIYDSRIARWLSVDFYFDKYPSYSPYSFSLNNPIYYVDYDGNDVRESSFVIKNNSKTAVTITGDGGTKRHIVGGCTNRWDIEDLKRQAVTLNPGDQFESKVWVSKDWKTKRMYGVITRADGTKEEVSLHDIDFIDVEEGQEITIEEDYWFWQSEEKTVTDDPDKEFNSGEHVQRSTTEGVDDGDTSNDKPDDWVQTPAKGEIKVTGNGEIILEGDKENKVEVKSESASFETR